MKKFPFLLCKLLIASCGLVVTNGCVFWTHYSNFDTGIIGSFEISYDSSGQCTAKLEGNYVRHGKSMQAESKTLQAANWKREDSQGGSREHIDEIVSCFTQITRSSGSKRTVAVVDLRYDPTIIIDGYANYAYQESGDVLAKLKIYLGSESESGVSIPGGICPRVQLDSNVMELKLFTENSKQQYLITGQGMIRCMGNQF